MQSKATTPEAYIQELPEERKEVIAEMHQLIKNNLPKGFQEGMHYGMIGYTVPHALYPGGYHCDPKQPLPFMSLASQKNYVSLYHMGMYPEESVNGIYEWFLKEYSKYSKRKLDMGKCCIRFKKMDDIPYPLIGELAKKVKPDEWIQYYEQAIKNSGKKK